ncbi:MAG: ORF6N domain-containing protein [Muribaculaceae bacterium]|nr:ORF6N domain-containing protein [Muribaculaceae bacterium]
MSISIKRAVKANIKRFPSDFMFELDPAEFNSLRCKNCTSNLEKYKDVSFEGDKVLPVISNQKMNDYIKELGKLAGVDTKIRITQYNGYDRIDTLYLRYELLCTHTGRKIFICKALSLGIPPNVVMKWTGHSDYKSMKPYIDIADSIKVNAMSRFE